MKNEDLMLGEILKDFKIAKRERFLDGEGIILVEKGEKKWRFYKKLRKKEKR